PLAALPVRHAADDLLLRDHLRRPLRPSLGAGLSVVEAIGLVLRAGQVALAAKPNRPLPFARWRCHARPCLAVQNARQEQIERIPHHDAFTASLQAATNSAYFSAGTSEI